MGRIRTVKPEFFESGNLAKVSRDARLLLVGLFTLADDEGRLRDLPKRIAGDIFPYDSDVDVICIEKWIEELENIGTIVRYTVGDDHFICLPNWTLHQRIDRPTPSKLPRCEAIESQLNANTRGLDESSMKTREELARNSRATRDTLDGKTRLEQGTGNREQGTGSAKPRTASKPKPSLEEFSVTEELQAWVKSKAPNASRAWVDFETEKFIGYYLESPKKLRSVTQAWRNWMLKAVDFNPPVKESEVSPFTYPILPPEVPRFLPSGLNANSLNGKNGDGSQ